MHVDDTPSKMAFSAEEKALIARIAKRQVRTLSEWKYLDTIMSTPTAVDSAGYMWDNSVIVQGDFANQRDGAQCEPSSITLKGALVVADSHNQFRFIVFQWFQDVVVNLSDILQDTTTSPVNSPYNAVNRTQYKILHDEMVGLSTYHPVHIVDKKIKIPTRKIYYQATDGTQGKNKIFMAFVSDSAVTSHPTVYMTTRLNFRDG